MPCTILLPISEVEDDPQSGCPHFNAFMVQVSLYALASYTCYGIPVLFAACNTDPLSLQRCPCSSICSYRNKHECALPNCQADMYFRPCFSSSMIAAKPMLGWGLHAAVERQKSSSTHPAHHELESVFYHDYDYNDYHWYDEYCCYCCYDCCYGYGACMLTCRCKVAEAVQDVDQDVLWRRQLLHPGNQRRHRTPPAPLFDALCS